MGIGAQGGRRLKGILKVSLDPLREHTERKYCAEDVEARARQKVGVLKEIKSFEVFFFV